MRRKRTSPGSAIAPKAAILQGALLVLTLSAARGESPDTAYLESFQKWEVELVEDLKQNWLPLAGLFWLQPGTNTFGSSADNTIVLPSAPARAGAFRLENDDVSLEIQPGVKAKIAGQPVTRARLESDKSGHPTVIELGSLRLHVIKRGKRIGIRAKDLDSAAVRNYPGPIFFPLDMNYRIVATFAPSDGKRSVDVPNVLGDVTPTPITGEVRFRLGGQELTLTALGGDSGKGLSFVFRDLTAQGETYPGGRFLDTGPVEDGKVVLDFNRAYNPPCAVTVYATCPLAPKENRLSVRIPAGEKYDSTHAHH